jgi:hypothetical protein
MTSTENRETVYDPQIEVLVEQLTHWGLNKQADPAEIKYILFKLVSGVLKKNHQKLQNPAYLEETLDSLQFVLNSRIPED